MIVENAQIWQEHGEFDTPILQIRVDSYPKDPIYIERKVGDGFAYIFIKDGYISSFYYDPKDREGCSGQIFVLPIKAESKINTKHLVGPYYSTSSVLNAIFIENEYQSIDCIIHESPNLIGVPGRITIAKAKQILDNFANLSEWTIVRREDYDEDEGRLLEINYPIIKKSI